MRIPIFLLISVTFFCCSYADSSQFYRQVGTTGIRHFVLQYPVATDLAQSVNCYRVERDTNGRIIEVVYIKDGKPAFNPVFHYSKLLIVYTDSSEIWRLLDLEGKPSIRQPDMAYYAYYYDSDGLPKEKINYDINGNMIEDSAGISKYLITSQVNERVTRVLRTNIAGDTIIDNDGVYEDRLTYDENGNIIEWAFYSLKGDLSRNKEGFAMSKFEYDKNRNNTQMTFLDENLHLCLNEALECARMRLSYDENGNISSMTSFRPDSSISADSGSLSLTSEALYDEKGNKIKMIVRCFDKGSRLNKVETEYDKNGEILTEIYFFHENEESPLAKAEVRYKDGKEIDTTYFDKDGNIIK